MHSSTTNHHAMFRISIVASSWFLVGACGLRGPGRPWQAICRCHSNDDGIPCGEKSTFSLHHFVIVQVTNSLSLSLNLCAVLGQQSAQTILEPLVQQTSARTYREDVAVFPYCSSCTKLSFIQHSARFLPPHSSFGLAFAPLVWESGEIQLPPGPKIAAAEEVGEIKSCGHRSTSF